MSTALTTNVAVSVLIILSTILTALYGFRATFKVFHGSSKLEKLPVESPSIMILPMVILSISVVLGWLVLDYQPLLPRSTVLKALDFLTVGASLTALVIGAGIAYLAFQSKIEATQRLVRRPLIQQTRKSLLQGMGFDKLYDFLWKRIVLPLSNVASSLQTGLLGINAASDASDSSRCSFSSCLPSVLKLYLTDIMDIEFAAAIVCLAADFGKKYYSKWRPYIVGSIVTGISCHFSSNSA